MPYEPIRNGHTEAIREARARRRQEIVDTFRSRGMLAGLVDVFTGPKRGGIVQQYNVESGRRVHEADTSKASPFKRVIREHVEIEPIDETAVTKPASAHEKLRIDVDNGLAPRWWKEGDEEAWQKEQGSRNDDWSPKGSEKKRYRYDAHGEKQAVDDDIVQGEVVDERYDADYSETDDDSDDDTDDDRD